MKILHTIDTTGPGGAETVFINLASEMRQRGHESIVVIRGKGWVYDQLISKGIEPVLINMKGSFDLNYVKQLIGIIKDNSVDVIQSHLLGSNVYCSLAGLLTGVPVVSTFHGFVDVKQRERFRWLKFQLINLGSKCIVFVSNFLKQGFDDTSNLSKNKAAVVYNGIDLNKFAINLDKSFVRKKLDFEETAIVVGSIGNIREAKGYDILLDAASLLKDVNPNIKFVIVGQGENKLHDRLLKKQKQLGLEKTVYFEGFQSNVSEYMQSFDYFLLSSTSEGFSISTIEAMASKVPVIVTASGGPEEIIQHEHNGLVVKVGSAQAIVNGILSVLANADTTLQRVERAYSDCVNKFSLQSMLNAYEKIYSGLLK